MGLRLRFTRRNASRFKGGYADLPDPLRNQEQRALVSSHFDGFDLCSANGLWSLRRRLEDEMDSFLVVSFVDQTRLMSLAGNISGPCLLS